MPSTMNTRYRGRRLMCTSTAIRSSSSWDGTGRRSGTDAAPSSEIVAPSSGVLAMRVTLSGEPGTERHVPAQVCALAGGMNPAVRDGVRPLEPARHEAEPRHGVRLDDVGRGTPGVARTLDGLDGAVGRHAHLDRAAGRTVGKLF